MKMRIAFAHLFELCFQDLIQKFIAIVFVGLQIIYQNEKMRVRIYAANLLKSSFNNVGIFIYSERIQRRWNQTIIEFFYKFRWIRIELGIAVADDYFRFFIIGFVPVFVAQNRNYRTYLAARCRKINAFAEQFFHILLAVEIDQRDIVTVQRKRAREVRRNRRFSDAAFAGENADISRFVPFFLNITLFAIP